jgi:hypothetical protein
MALTLEQYGLDQLPPEVREELAGLLWESLQSEPVDPPQWHIAEIEKRLADSGDNEQSVAWREFKKTWLEGS